MVSASLVLLASLVSLVSARLPDGRLHGNMMPLPIVPKVLVEDSFRATPVVSRNGTELPPYNTTYYFDQLIDHNDPSKGTFKQRFWHTYEFYEPGGPIIIMTPGEGNADGYDGYLTNRTINGLIAQQQNASTIVIEHRFYGESNPLPDLSSESLKLLDIQQALDDFEYFAHNVVLPMPNGDQVGPDKAPWIIVGGSYSGQLTSYAMVNKPDLFFAGYSSSGVVQTIIDFWQYFEPIREHMPANCSADVQAVIAHVDEIFTSNDTDRIQELKETFGLGGVSHLDDAAGALRNNLWDWQSLSPASGANAQFFRFCDALEVKDGVSAGPEGWGLDHALPTWGSYFSGDYLTGLCGDFDVETCFGTYDANSTFYTDTSVDNSWRSWFWQVCTQEGYFQNSASEGHPTLVSRLLHPAYDLRQCTLMFPEAFPEPPIVDVNGTNTKYLGWDVREENLFFANAFQDPWRDATMGAEGLNAESTPEQPLTMSNGFHCSDLSANNGRLDPTVGAVQTQALASMKAWFSTYSKRSVEARTGPPANVNARDRASSERIVKPINAWNRAFGESP